MTKQKRKRLLIEPNDLEKLGVNNTLELLETMEQSIKNSIVRVTRNSTLTNQEKKDELNSLNLMLDLVPQFKKNL